jgi:pimeloyl-ACP methyl ester carboxylesterase
MASFGFESYGVLGISGGGPFAIATAVVEPTRVTRLGVAVGIGPWRDLEPPDDPAGLEDRQILELLDTGDIDGALDGFRANAARDFGELLAQPDEVFLDYFVAHMAARDRAWFDPIGERWIRDWREALSSYDGYALDNVAWGGPWDIAPGEVAVPTRLWAGDEDTSVPLRHAEWLHAQLPGSDLVVRRESGHGGAVFPHWTEMLTWLGGHDPRTDAVGPV